MKEFYAILLSFITNKNHRLTTRALGFAAIILSLMLLNNFFGVSLYFTNGKKLEQLTTLSTLLKDTALSKETHAKLLVMEKELFERQTLVGTGWHFLTGLFTSNNVGTAPKSEMRPPNNLLFFISSSFIFIIGVLVMIAVIFIDQKTPFWEMVTIAILASIAFLLGGMFNYWLFGKIFPKMLLNSWTYNYVLNGIMHILMVAFLMWSTKKLEKSIKNRRV
jgi:hypothetical protein